MPKHSQHRRTPRIGLIVIYQHKGIHVILQPMLLQQVLPRSRLQRSKLKPVVLIMPDHKVHTAVAEFTNTVKQDDQAQWIPV